MPILASHRSCRKIARSEHHMADQHPAGRESEGIRVLVIEDSFMIVSLLELVFENFGWTMVGPATRVAAALELIESERIDAALLDVNLAGEMSWPVAEALQAHGIPFVLSTGYEVGHIMPESLKGVKFIRKPYNAPGLKRTIDDLFAK